MTNTQKRYNIVDDNDVIIEPNLSEQDAEAMLTKLLNYGEDLYLQVRD